MTSKEIHERRKELEDQLANVLKRYGAVGGEQARVENEARECESAVAEARLEKARGIIGVDLDGAIERAGATAAQVVEAKEETNAVYQARGEVERQLDAFLAAHFSLFAEDAEKLTEKAAKAFAIADRGILGAEKLWNEAVLAWRPLCRAAKIQPVPAFPLSRAVPVPARPPSISTEGDVAA